MHDHMPADLERQLRELGDRDDLFPKTPDVAEDVSGVIRSGEAFPISKRESRWLPVRTLRVAAMIALLVLVTLAAAVAIPGSRSAIAEFFGIEGIRIELDRDEEVELPGTPTSIGGSLLLGERTTIDEAAGTAPFDVVIPADAAAGKPDEIYRNERSGVTVIGMLWHARDDLPEIGATGVGMLLLEIESDDDDVIFVKRMVGGGEFNTATVNNMPGYWIEDGVLAVEPVEGLMLDLLEPETRRSGNVLIWSDGEITYRLETKLPMDDAVRIAESLAPVEETKAP